MKIPLNLKNNGTPTPQQEQAMHVERDIIAAQKGDWTARSDLINAHKALIRSLAEKHSQDGVVIDKLVAAGEEAVGKAILKYNITAGPERFQLFAMEYINKAMDRLMNPGFFARLFGAR